MLKITTLIIFLLLNGLGYAQQSETYLPQKLLIVVDAAKNERLRITTIQNCLKDLLYENDKGRSVYDSVFDINDIYKSAFIESLIYDFNKSDSALKFNSRERAKRDENYRDALLHFDQVLFIKIVRPDAQSNIYYYDFTLFSIVADTIGKLTIPVTSRLGNGAECSIDPSSISCEGILCKTIHQVCVGTNIPPRVHIISNAVRTPQGYYLAKDDTLLLQLNVVDPDTRRERLRYDWTQIPDETTGYAVLINRHDTVQQVVIRYECSLKFIVKVNDRLVDSKPDTFIIHVIRRPVIIDYFKGSFVKIGKRSGRVTHPFDDLYQPYLFSRKIDIIEFNRHYIWTAGNRPIDIGLVFTDSTRSETSGAINVSKEFRVDRIDTVFMIRQEALSKRADTFYYQITLADHGIKAPSLTIEQIYRKSTPVYWNFGFVIARFKPIDEPFNFYSTVAIGFFVYPGIHLEYGIEFPLSDSVFDRGHTRKYPNHRITIITPLPFKFNKKGLLVALESNLLISHYPSISEEVYTGLGFGLNIRMFYNPFPWLGVSYHIQYATLHGLSWQLPTEHLLMIGLGFILLPVRK